MDIKLNLMNQKGSLPLFTVVFALFIIGLISATVFTVTTPFGRGFLRSIIPSAITPPRSLRPFQPNPGRFRHPLYDSNSNRFGAKSPSPTSTSVSTNIPLMVMAQFADGITNLLKPGDYVVALAGRNNQPDTPLSEYHFSLSTQSLNNITSPSINKMITFSSIDDLKTYLSSLPENVNYIAYDTEDGMTPSSEINSLPSVIAQFAALVHQSGKKMVWGPSFKYFDTYQSNGQLAAILSSLDGVLYQGQRLLPSEGQTEFISQISTKYKYVKSVHSSTLFFLQLWTPTSGSDSSIENALNGCLGSMDVAVVGAGGPNGQSDTQTIIQGLNF